ncbi:MAG: hypothetical protein NVS3B1_29420 [Marmoricola sp.]
MPRLSWVHFECERCWFETRVQIHIEEDDTHWWPAKSTLSGDWLRRVMTSHTEPHCCLLEEVGT